MVAAQVSVRGVIILYWLLWCTVNGIHYCSPSLPLMIHTDSLCVHRLCVNVHIMSKHQRVRITHSCSHLPLYNVQFHNLNSERRNGSLNFYAKAEEQRKPTFFTSHSLFILTAPVELTAVTNNLQDTRMRKTLLYGMDRYVWEDF